MSHRTSHINHPKAYVIFDRIANSIGDAFFHEFAKQQFRDGVPENVMDSVDILPLMIDFALHCLNDPQVGAMRFANGSPWREEQVADVSRYWLRLKHLGERELIPPEEWPPYKPRSTRPNFETVLSAWYQAAYAFWLGYYVDFHYIEGYSATQFDFALGSLSRLHIWQQMQRNKEWDAWHDKLADRLLKADWNQQHSRLGAAFVSLIKQHVV